MEKMLLQEKVFDFMKENTPQLILSLSETPGGVTNYIEGLVSTKIPAIESLLTQGYQPHERDSEIMKELAAGLIAHTSRYEVVEDLLESNYAKIYKELSDLGLVKIVLVAFLDFSTAIFDKYKDSEKESSYLKFEILAAMEEYFSA